MNLNFTTVKTILVDNRVCQLQKAAIADDDGRFWSSWRSAKKDEVSAKLLHADSPRASLKSFIHLSREQSNDGTINYFAWRLMPADKTQPVKFPLSYRLRDHSKLLPYQPLAVAHLCNAIITHGAAADGSDTGIGKTYHSIAVARDLYLRPGIICRKAGIATWKNVCVHFNIKPLFIVNWELAKTQKFPYAKKLRSRLTGQYWFKWELPKNTMLIFDEAHMGAVDGSQNAALWASSGGIPSVSCSATFADRPVRLRNLFSVLDIMPHAQFFSWLRERGCFVNQYGEAESLSDVEDMKYINKILYPRFGYRLSYDDPAVKKWFPPVVCQAQIVSLSARQTIIQNRMYADLVKKVEHYRALGKQADVLVADLRYRQEAELLKVDVIKELVENHVLEGKSVVVFVNFRETLSVLARVLKTKSLIFGNQDKFHLDREKIIADFQSDKSRLILSMVQAGGQSISLHDITGRHPRVSLICPTYDPVALRQVVGRTHRARSCSVPVVKLVYSAGTVEEKVAQTVSRKLDNIEALNDGDLMERDIFNLKGVLHEKAVL